MSEFSDRTFVAGSLFGLRAFNVDRLGRLTGVTVPAVFTPNENDAKCKKPDTMSIYYSFSMPRMVFGPNGDLQTMEPQNPEKAAVKPPHTTAGIDCTCGYHAYFDGENDYKEPNRIAGIIEGYSVCTVGSRGFRASKAGLVAVIAPKAKFHDVTRWELVARNYPDVPVYDSKRDALDAHPLSTALTPHPSDEDFWTRST